MSHAIVEAAVAEKNVTARICRTDRQLLAELTKKPDYNKFVDPSNFIGVLRHYISLSALCQIILYGKFYWIIDGIVILTILLAGTLVGIQTYTPEDPTLMQLETIVLIIFSVEIVIKLISEGTRPNRFFRSGWNVFDFIIVLFSLPAVSELFGGGSVTLLRLFRLTRLVKLVKKIPQLQIIVGGLIGGFSSMFYIVILLFMVFYLYGIAGIFAFRDNDPFHFKSIPQAIVTLFQASTLEGWADIYYVNALGCDKWKSGIYVPPNTEGVDEMFWCRNPKAQPIIGPIYWVSFELISSMVMLSLFVGAVTMSMGDSMNTMKIEQEETKRKKVLLAELKKANGTKLEPVDEERPSNAPKFTSLTAWISKLVASRQEYAQRRKSTATGKSVRKNLFQAWSIEIEHEHDTPFNENPSILHQAEALYLKLAIYCRLLIQHQQFTTVMTYTILVAAMLVGMQTDTYLVKVAGHVLEGIDILVLVIFILEMVMKIISLEDKPLTYFNSSWNVFDFIIIVGSLIPGVGSMIIMLRMLRLFRILKLIRSLPELAVIVEALMIGVSSIGFIGVILFFVFYMFSILAMMLFGLNDPWHFGSLHMSMLTLFQLATYDSWMDVMYTNILGCKLYGYEDRPHMCEDGHAVGLAAALFFVCFEIMGAMVLLTLFVGVVTTSMENANKKRDEEVAMELRIVKFCMENNISDETVAIFRQVFEVLDVLEEGTIGQVEIKIALHSVGIYYTDDEISDMIADYDKKNGTDVIVADFIEIMGLAGIKLVSENLQSSPPELDSPSRKAIREIPMLTIPSTENGTEYTESPSKRRSMLPTLSSLNSLGDLAAKQYSKLLESPLKFRRVVHPEECEEKK